jgi:hypothetical protein
MKEKNREKELDNTKKELEIREKELENEKMKLEIKLNEQKNQKVKKLFLMIRWHFMSYIYNKIKKVN